LNEEPVNDTDNIEEGDNDEWDVEASARLEVKI
jgi:hypothetical protein